MWSGEEWLELWKKEIVVPLVKKGEEEMVKQYRGITVKLTHCGPESRKSGQKPILKFALNITIF